MKKSFYTLLFSLLAIGVFAQDPHLSQFYMAPMYLNPALTGAFDGNYRLNALFRGQWGSVLQNEAVPMYQTYTFSADFRTNKGLSKGDAFGFGASFFGDHAGDAKFGYNVGQVAISYQKSLNGSKATNFLAVGFSSSIYNQTLDYSLLQFGSQWDPTKGGYNPNLPTNEGLVSNKLWYWDVNAGLLWYMKITKRTNVYLGAAMYHINQPNVSMLGGDVKLNSKYVGHGGVRFPLAGRFDLQPKFIFLYQGQSIETELAADFRILFDEREPEGNNFKVGAMLRMVGGDPSAPWQGNALSPESVIFTAGFDWNNLTLGVAYDVTVSQLITGDQSRGGFEIGLTYVGAFQKRRPQTIYCPRF